MPEQRHVEIIAKGHRYDIRTLTSGKVCIYRNGTHQGTQEIREFMNSLAGENFKVLFLDGRVENGKIYVHGDDTLNDAIVSVEKFTVVQLEDWRM